VLGVLWLALVAAPPWFVHDRSLQGLKVQNEVRTTLLQGLGGVVLLVGAYFTYRQVTNSREQLAHSREQLQIAQQGQITERFTRAIDQLGHAQLDVRLGGIYALERIARDSPADRATIGEVLTAFVRSHAPWPPRLPGQYVATAPIAEVPELQVRAADAQASLTVLGRGGFALPAQGQGDRLDLHAVDLRHASLSGAHLEEATLSGAHLEEATLSGAHLEEATLSGAHLEQAILGDAHLEQANLRGAHLKGTLADAATTWPEGFDWRAAGVVVLGRTPQPTGHDDMIQGLPMARWWCRRGWSRAWWRWSHDHRLHGALVVAFAVQWSPPAVAPMVAATSRPLAVAAVVALTVTATVRLRLVAPVVAATGRLQTLAPLVAVAGQVAQATNRPLGVPPSLPLLQRSILPAGFGSERALGVVDPPALPVLHHLPDRAIPRAATLDRRRTFAQLTRPGGPLQLDRACGHAPLPGLFAHDRAVLGGQVGVGLPVGVVLLLGVAQVAFAVRGTVGGLPGDLPGLLGLLGLLSCPGEVAPA
jgi:Pentapeptide repeats (8 copies)